MKESIYNEMVNNVWDLDLSKEDKGKVMTEVSGNPSDFEMSKYTKGTQKLLREKMVEMKYVKSFEAIQKEEVK